MAQEWNGWLPGAPLLPGKVAMVAGGAQGIGQATTRVLAAAGATVAVVDVDGEGAEAVAKEVSASGGRAHAFAADLRDEQACANAVDRVVAALGGVDVLANVAGGMSKHAQLRPLREWTTDNWDYILHLNLRYVFWLSRSIIPAMERRGGGAIVNVTSIAGVFGCPDQGPYGAAKAGLINLTKTLSVECGPLGIRVNAVSPGVTLTDAVLTAMPEERRRMVRSTTPLEKLGHPEDIARAVLFFASPLSEQVTGQMLLVDGGVSVNFPYPSLY